MNKVLSPETLQAVGRYLDKNQEQHEEIGRLLFNYISSTQIRNLQQIVFTAIRYTAVSNFIKNQMGKEGSKRSWTAQQGKEMVGDIVLTSLETIRLDASEIAKEFDQCPFGVALNIAKGWVEQVTTEYLYCKARGEV